MTSPVPEVKELWLDACSACGAVVDPPVRVFAGGTRQLLVCDWCGCEIGVILDRVPGSPGDPSAVQTVATMRRMCALLEEIVGNTERRRRE